MSSDDLKLPAPDMGQHSIRLLLIGGCAGLLLGALVAAGKLGTDLLPDTIVATVNGVPLATDEYRRALNVFGSEKREPVSERDRALVLERMIEEELLLQHGVALGITRGNNKSREEALRSVLAGLVIELDSSGSEPGSKHDERLAQYLAGLKATSSIRWVEAAPQ